MSSSEYYISKGTIIIRDDPNIKLIGKELRLVVSEARNDGEENWMKVVKRYKLALM